MIGTHKPLFTSADIHQGDKFINDVIRWSQEDDKGKNAVNDHLINILNSKINFIKIRILSISNETLNVWDRLDTLQMEQINFVNHQLATAPESMMSLFVTSKQYADKVSWLGYITTGFTFAICAILVCAIAVLCGT